MIRENARSIPSGYGHLFSGILGYLVSVFLFTRVETLGVPALAMALLLVLISTLVLVGLFVVNPNEARVLQLFGKYTGTARDQGLRWANPFYSKKKISVRIRNFETGKLKVNDSAGNPIEIASVVVWRVVDTAEAKFNVDDYRDFVHVQSESALRNLATRYPYVNQDEEEQKTLSGHTVEISHQLKAEVQERLEKAGIEVLEARISHLAYAPEIASAMLRRQQAGAVIAARQKIVDGAVGMVESALHQLSSKGVLDLDEERKAAMVSNLMVVLCSDRETTPVVNAGSLHH